VSYVRVFTKQIKFNRKFNPAWICFQEFHYHDYTMTGGRTTSVAKAYPNSTERPEKKLPLLIEFLVGITLKIQ